MASSTLLPCISLAKTPLKRVVDTATPCVVCMQTMEGRPSNAIPEENDRSVAKPLMTGGNSCYIHLNGGMWQPTVHRTGDSTDSIAHNRGSRHLSSHQLWQWWIPPYRQTTHLENSQIAEERKDGKAAERRPYIHWLCLRLGLSWLDGYIYANISGGIHYRHRSRVIPIKSSRGRRLSSF